MLILQINWSADAGKGRSVGGAHSHQPPCLSTFDKTVSIEMLILHINWSADAGKGGSTRGAHSHQLTRLSTFDKQFL
jgi:hypothetical protein